MTILLSLRGAERRSNLLKEKIFKAKWIASPRFPPWLATTCVDSEWRWKKLEKATFVFSTI